MTFLRWLPIILVLPTFAFIGYWVWRCQRGSDTGTLPRTPEELRHVGSKFEDEFTSTANRLRRLNLWIWLTIIAVAFGASVYNTWFRR